MRYTGEPSGSDGGPAPGVPSGVDWVGLRERLRRIALGLTRDRHAAEDLVQEAIARVLATRPDLAHHEGYAVTTLTRRWLSEQRRASRRAAWLGRYAAGRVWAVFDAGASLDADGRRARFERAVADLPPTQRAALVLRVAAGLDYGSIAAALECEVGAVRSNLHLARARLRKALADLGPEGDGV